MKLLVKINLLLSFKALPGLLHIDTILRKIELQKEQFCMEIEVGDEVPIPNELKIDCYPMSYWFYDPILNVVDSTISNERKELYFLRNQLNVKNFKQTNLIQKIKTFHEKKEKKLSFKY